MRQGEYLFTHGSLYLSDTFSWTMPGYHWINHEWLYDPIMYLIYITMSFWGLSVAGAVVSVGAFYFCVKGIKLRPYQLAICAFLFGYLTSGVVWQGLRSQMVGLLCIAIVMYMLRMLDSGSKKAYIVLPAFFLLWANLHGTFTFGLFIFGLYVVQAVFVNSFKNGKMYISKNSLFLLASFVASILVTLINPFGIGVYFEALRHFSDPLLKYIGEWNPVEFPSTFYFLMVAYAIALFTLIVVDYRKTKRINIYAIGVALFTAYLAYGARRYVAVLIVSTLPFFATYLSNLHLPLYKYKSTNFLLALCIVIAFEMSIFGRIIPWRIFQNYSYSDYCTLGSQCSENLTTYLKANPPQGKGFNFYDWGGYLIGRGVQAKLFIDGRMHLWKDEQTGFQPFAAYQNMYYDGNIELFDKYDFDWVLVPTNSNISAYLQLKKVKGKWVKKFDDGRAVYWVRVR